MPDRITKANLQESVANLNRRMVVRQSIYRYTVEGRSGYFALDRVLARDGSTQDTITAGTKRELHVFLRAMMVALDDAERKDPERPNYSLHSR